MTSPLHSARLKRFFFAIVDGKLQIQTSDNAKLFLGAIFDQEDRVQCIVTLSSKKYALQAVRKSLCTDLSPEFLNGLGAQCVRYFANEDIRQLNGGQLLRDLLIAILTPPLFWEAFKEAAARRRLSQDGLHAFALLLLELLIVLPPTSDVLVSLRIRQVARSVLDNNQLLESPVSDVRSVGYQIQVTNDLSPLQRTRSITWPPKLADDMIMTSKISARLPSFQRQTNCSQNSRHSSSQQKPSSR